MKRAYVHVLKFTELTLYVERSLGCFAFIKYKKGASFIFTKSSIGFVSQHHERHKRQRSTKSWTLILLRSHFTSVLDPCGFFFVVFFFDGFKHTGEKKRKGRRWWNSPCSLLYADLSTWNNDGIRKSSFMVPEYNFCFISFVCVVGCFVFFLVLVIFKLQASSVRSSVCLYLLMKMFHKEPIKKK